MLIIQNNGLVNAFEPYYFYNFFFRKSTLGNSKNYFLQVQTTYYVGACIS